MKTVEGNKTIPAINGYRPKGINSRMARLEDLVNVIQEMNERQFTGYIKINFTQGGIGRIEKYEEILRNTPQAE